MTNRMFQPRILTRAVALLMFATAQQQVAGSDASIYTNPAGSTANSTAMFLLDNSGSMTFDDSYDGESNVRINRLKDAMQRVLVGDSSGDPLKSASGQDFNIGLAHFTPSTTGRIAVPALLSEQRSALPVSSSSTTLSATSLFPSSATFDYANRRDGAGTRSDNNATLELANLPASTLGNRWWRADTNDAAFLRFHIDIPKGATVTSATLKLPATSITNGSVTANMAVEIEPVDNAAAVVTTAADMNARFTNALRASKPVAVKSSLSFDVTSLVNTQVNRAGWCGMNAVNFRLLTTNTNTSYTFYVAGTNTEVNQPQLSVTWTMTPTARAATCMGIRTERTTNSPTWTATKDYITNLDQMTQRHYLNLEVQRIIGNTSTPTARAYAETVAYLMGTTSYNLTGNGYSLSTDNAKTATGTAGLYKSPLPPNTGTGSVSSSCVSNGIFTLTDGEPNGGASAAAIAQQALGASSFSCANSLPDTGRYDTDSDDSGWSCIGAMAKALFPSNANSADDARTANKSTYPVRSVVVGFGPSSFWNGSSSDAQNAQTWASTSYGGGLKIKNSDTYGSGFTQAASKTDVVDFIQRFFNSFEASKSISSNGSGIAPGSFGTAGADQRYVYYPLFDPEMDSSVWYGNLKRYKVDISATKQTIIDRNGKPILTPVSQDTSVTNAGSLFNSDTTDFWNAASTPDGADILAGGLVSQMTQPRRLFIDMSSTGTPIVNGALTQVDPTTIDAAAQASLMTALANQMAPVDPSLSLLAVPKVLSALDQLSYTKNYLWWLFNYDVKSLAEGAGTANYQRTTVVKNRMGGVFHSQPEVITTQIKRNVDAAGKETTSQTDYLMFGTMQGLVQVIEASTGKEQFAFAPTELLDEAKTMLPPSNQIASGGALVKAPLFYGMDSPWTSYTERSTATVGSQKTLTATKIHAFGGMRMGGTSYYGLDLTGLGQGQITPKVLFKITPNSAGFGSLAQTWSQPVVANMRVNGAKKRVIIFGGGYDPRYEAVDSAGVPTYVPGSGVTASVVMPGGTTQSFSGIEKGAAVYIADAETGALIGSVSSAAQTSTNTNSADFKYSIPSAVKVTDRDADGYIDNVYVGDLGGQVFRIDLSNYPASGAGLVRRVVKLASLNTTAKVDGVRFYEPPSFAPLNDTINNIRVGFVSIGSGNASFPMRLSTQDYAFGLFDWDVMSSDLYSRSTEKTAPNTGFDKLVQLKNAQSKDTLAGVINQTVAAATRKDGWYYALPSSKVASPTTSTTAASKALVRTSIIDGVMNLTAFDPTRNTNTCGAGIKGATTTYRICLPYGACGTSATTKINQTFLGAGIGKPLLVGNLTSGLKYVNDSSLTGTTAPKDCASGSTSALCDKYTFQLKVKPMHRWREVTSEKYK